MIRNISKYQCRYSGSLSSSSSIPLSLSLLSRTRLCSYSTSLSINNNTNNNNSNNNVFKDIISKGNPSNLERGKLRLSLQKLLVEDGGIPYITDNYDNNDNNTTTTTTNGNIKNPHIDLHIMKKKILLAIVNSNDDNNLPLLQDLFQLDTITPSLLSLLLKCYDTYNKDNLALDLYKSLHVAGIMQFNDKHLVSLLKALKSNANKNVNTAINIYNDITSIRELSKSNKILLKHIIEFIVEAKVNDDNEYYYNYVRQLLQSYYSSSSGIGQEKVSDYTYLFLLIGRLPVSRRAEVMSELWGEMLSKGLTPTAHTYTAKMSSSIASNRMIETLEIYHEMRQKHITPSSSTFVKLMTACTMVGQHQFGLLLFLKYMNGNGILDWPLCRSVLKLMNDIHNSTKHGVDNEEKLHSIMKSIDSIESLEIIRRKYEHDHLYDKAMDYIIKRVRPPPGRIQEDAAPKDLIFSTMADFIRIGELDKILRKHDSLSSKIGQDDILNVKIWESTICKLGHYGEWRAILALMAQLQSYRYYEWNDNIWRDLQSEAYVALIRSNQLERSKKLLKEMIANPNHVLSRSTILKVIVNKMQNCNSYVYISILVNSIVEVDGKLDDEYKIILKVFIENLNKSNVSTSNTSESDIKTLRQLII